MSGALRRLLHPVYRALETTGHPLRYLFVEITQRCNLRCRHCGSDCSREPHAGELTTTEWLQFFAYLGRRFDPRRLVLVVTGGEPLCHPDFFELTAGLQAQGLAWGLVSNGWALTPRNVERIIESGATSATVSVDGLMASHDWLRGATGAFERAVRGLETLAAAGLPFFDVVTCAHPKNLAELPEVLELLVRLGVPAWRLFTIFPRGRAKHDRELRLTDGQLGELMAFIRRARQDGRLRVDYSCEGYLPPALDAEVRDEPYFCRAGISIGSVLCDGSISACPNIDRALVQGNIRTDDFATVWEERFGRFRRRSWMQTGECVGCADFSRCQGNSMHLWDAETERTALCHRRALAHSAR